MTWEGYAIIPPVESWDEKHRAEIEITYARSTLAETPAKAWEKHVTYRGQKQLDALEITRQTQLYHDCGYRVTRVRLQILKEPSLT